MTETVNRVRLAPENRTVLVVLLVSAFVAFLNETILGVALPKIMAEMNIEASTGQWLSTAYMLTMAIVIPLTGYLLQRFTTKQMYVLAMVTFSLGTLMSALSVSFGMLLVGRVLQASGTAVMMPLLMTGVMTLVPEAIRGRFMGNVTVVLALAPALGPPVAGLVLTGLDWRWLFWFVLPIAVGVLLLGIVRMGTNPASKVHAPDVWSIILSALGFSGLVYGLSSFGEAARGHSLISPYVPVSIGLAVLIVFVWRQIRLARTDRALLDLRPFRSRTYTFGMLIMTACSIALFGVSILTPIFAQEVVGMSVLTTGLFMLPGGLLMGLLGPVVGRLYDRWGPRALILPGSIVTSIAMWFIASFTASTQPWQILVANIVLSLGLSFVFTPLFTVSMSSVPSRFYSHSSAIIGTVQQLMGAAGTALFVTVLTAVQVSQMNDGRSEVSAMASGMQAAFLCGAIVSLAPIVLAIFIKAPASDAEMERELAA